MILLTVTTFTERSLSTKSICGFNVLPEFDNFITILQNEHKINLDELGYSLLFTNKSYDIHFNCSLNKCRFQLEEIPIY